MFLRPAQLSLRVIPLTRTISTTPTLLSKASKARVTSPKSKSLLKPKQPTVASNAPTTSASRPAASLFEAAPAASEHVEASHEASGQEDPVKAAVGETEQLRQVERLRGTGVGASERVYPIGDAVVGREEGAGAVGIAPSHAEVSPTPPAPAPIVAASSPPIIDSEASSTGKGKQQANHDTEFSPEETIYTAHAPFSVPLVLTAVFVFAVFSLTGADNARVGLASWNEEKQVHELAPAWKRYTFATGFAAVAIGATAWGALAPARIITKLTIRRPLSSTTPFPHNSRVTIHTPITRFPFLSARTVKLEDIHLLGPLSQRPQTWHPKTMEMPPSAPRKGRIAETLRHLKKTLIAPSKPRKTPKPWGTNAVSHSPIVIRGDRASYSLAVRRGLKGVMGEESGAWCEDWEGLERALLEKDHRAKV